MCSQMVDLKSATTNSSTGRLQGPEKTLRPRRLEEPRQQGDEAANLVQVQQHLTDGRIDVRFILLQYVGFNPDILLIYHIFTGQIQSKQS